MSHPSNFLLFHTLLVEFLINRVSGPGHILKTRLILRVNSEDYRLYYSLISRIKIYKRGVTFSVYQPRYQTDTGGFSYTNFTLEVTLKQPATPDYPPQIKCSRGGNTHLITVILSRTTTFKVENERNTRKREDGRRKTVGT